MAQSDGAKPNVQKKKQMLIRYGRMGVLGWFDHHESKIPKVNSRVVIKTKRGLELGELVGRFSYKGGHFKSTPQQVDEYFGGKGRDYPLGEGGTFVRFATPQDLMEQEHLEVSAREEAKCCDKFIKEMNLAMKIVDSEHLFGGERIVLYFSSNGRVDFRDLVRRLAREYQTRIELRQIGSRDEAKLISDFESCGQECCCRRFLKMLEPVNMRMAKLQKATLDPSKISGHCGRLKCCLRYEDDTYRDLKKRLPNRNVLVKTPKGTGKVTGTQILTQLVMVQDVMGKREAFPLDEIELIDESKECGSKPCKCKKDDPEKATAIVSDPPVKAEAVEVKPKQEKVPEKSGEKAVEDGSEGGNKSRRNRNRNRNRNRRNRNKNKGDGNPVEGNKDGGGERNRGDGDKNSGGDSNRSEGNKNGGGQDNQR